MTKLKFILVFSFVILFLIQIPVYAEGTNYAECSSDEYIITDDGAFDSAYLLMNGIVGESDELLLINPDLNELSPMSGDQINLIIIMLCVSGIALIIFVVLSFSKNSRR